jgi:hypothetical protein
MRLPVDTSVVSFVSAGPAELCFDFDTRQLRHPRLLVGAVSRVLPDPRTASGGIRVQRFGQTMGWGKGTPINRVDERCHEAEF